MLLNKLSVPSLRHMCLAKIAVTICNDQEIKAVVKKYGSAAFVFLSKETDIFLRKLPTSITEELNPLRITECQMKVNVDSHTSFNTPIIIKPEVNGAEELRMPLDLLPSKKWEDLVRNKISSTPLPPAIQDELFVVVRVMTFEIYNWMKDHSDVVRSSADLQCSFQWKSQGKIDRKKTAEVLISSPDLPLKSRFNLACLYNFEEESFSLWNRMSANEKKSVWIHFGSIPLWFVNDWMHSEGNASESVLEGAKKQSPLLLRRDIIRNFQRRKKNCFINGIISKSVEYEDFILTLSGIEADTRAAVFRHSALQVLQYFLDWPLQNLFLDVADFLMPHLNDKDFLELLIEIINRRILVGWLDYDYVSLLKEFWSRGPAQLKRLVKHSSIYKPLMLLLNHNSTEPFPTEVLFDHYREECLVFRYQGVKYCLFKSIRSFDTSTNWRNIMIEEFKGGCKRIHGILFSNAGKRKFRQM